MNYFGKVLKWRTPLWKGFPYPFQPIPYKDKNLFRNCHIYARRSNMERCHRSVLGLKFWSVYSLKVRWQWPLSVPFLFRTSGKGTDKITKLHMCSHWSAPLHYAKVAEIRILKCPKILRRVASTPQESRKSNANAKNMKGVFAKVKTGLKKSVLINATIFALCTILANTP